MKYITYLIVMLCVGCTTSQEARYGLSKGISNHPTLHKCLKAAKANRTTASEVFICRPNPGFLY